jgi:SAM-dependent methyltransferase
MIVADMESTMSTTHTETLIRMFQFEKNARQRLLSTTRDNRKQVFEEVYGSFYEQFGEDVASESEEKLSHKLKWQSLLFSPLVSAGAKVLELGCGKAALLKKLAKSGITCVGIDAHVRDPSENTDNLCFIQGDIVDLDVGIDTRFDLIYSDQVIEHLHPEDVSLHFQNVKKLLKENGRYAFSLPSSLIGPGDVSAHFGCKTAEGLHLKEWRYNELWPVLKNAGYTNVKSLLINPRLTGGMHIYTPIQFKILLENFFSTLPKFIRKAAGKVFMLSIYLIAK